jgi:Spy/CpxP family protein refolding chaperone
MNISSVKIRSNGLRNATLALCALAIGTTPMWSQEAALPPPPPQQADAPPPPPHQRPNREQMQERQIEHLTKHLNLTADQATQIRAVYKDTDTQMESLHQDTSTPREQKWEKMKSIHETAQTKIRALLTEEQKPKFDEMVARQREHMEHEGRPGAPLPPPPPPPA